MFNVSALFLNIRQEQAPALHGAMQNFFDFYTSAGNSNCPSYAPITSSMDFIVGDGVLCQAHIGNRLSKDIGYTLCLRKMWRLRQPSSKSIFAISKCP